MRFSTHLIQHVHLHRRLAFNRLLADAFSHLDWKHMVALCLHLRALRQARSGAADPKPSPCWCTLVECTGEEPWLEEASIQGSAEPKPWAKTGPEEVKEPHPPRS